LKSHFTTMVVAFTLTITALTFAGCSKSGSGSSTTTSGSSGGSLSDELGVKVPTQEEADAAAAREINAANADDEFNRLQQEAEVGE